MKGGANPTDIRQIKKYFEAGHKAEDISRSMNISLKCVESFRPETHAKTKATIKKAEDEAAKEHKAKKEVMKKAKQEVAE